MILEGYQTLAEYLNSQFSGLQNLDFFIRILVACLCGACIGFERSKRLKEAGIRTHIIVCCSAALMMIVSKYGFADLTQNGVLYNGTRGADAARIAAQVVSGVSFLGAGIIFRNGNSIKGLTTAAGIWATAGVGLAIGAGMYAVGLFAMVVVMLFQILMHKIKVGGDSMVMSRVQFTVRDREHLRDDVMAQLDKWKAQASELSIAKNDDGTVSYNVLIRMHRAVTVKDMDELLPNGEDVRSITIVPSI